jgi:hypothetical protein
MRYLETIVRSNISLRAVRPGARSVSGRRCLPCVALDELAKCDEVQGTSATTPEILGLERVSDTRD